MEQPLGRSFDLEKSVGVTAVKKITKAGKGIMENFLSGNELTRMILELRVKGWTDTEIIEHILTIIG